jgi:predicted ATPase
MDRDDPFIRRIQFADDAPAAQSGYPWSLPAVRSLQQGLDLHPKVTYLVGENGTGKSTLLESIAVAAGLNPEGGSSNFDFGTHNSHSQVWERLRLVRGTRVPSNDFFLRAESLFNAATYLDELTPDALDAYGGVSLHEQSHGESFLAVIINRFGPQGLYFLDEPEAALSAQNCLTCLRRIHELVLDGAQFVIATHSPILLAYPDAAIYECSDDGIRQVDFDEVDAVRLTRAFLDAPGRFLGQLFA